MNRGLGLFACEQEFPLDSKSAADVLLHESLLSPTSITSSLPNDLCVENLSPTVFEFNTSSLSEFLTSFGRISSGTICPSWCRISGFLHKHLMHKLGKGVHVRPGKRTKELFILPGQINFELCDRTTSDIHHKNGWGSQRYRCQRDFFSLEPNNPTEKGKQSRFNNGCLKTKVERKILKKKD